MRRCSLPTKDQSRSCLISHGWATHRFFIEPLTGNHHVSRILVGRYMSFIEKIKKSSKSALKLLLDVVKDDVRLTTGHNLRTIMMFTNKNTIGELNVGNVESEYYKVEEMMNGKSR
jgi:hypothetical protein